MAGHGEGPPLNAKGPFLIKRGFLKQAIWLKEHLRRVLFCFTAPIAPSVNPFAQQGTSHRLFGYDGHVPRRRLMIGMKEAMGIDKVSMFAANLFEIVVHAIDKLRNRSS